MVQKFFFIIKLHWQGYIQKYGAQRQNLSQKWNQQTYKRSWQMKQMKDEQRHNT